VPRRACNASDENARIMRCGGDRGDAMDRARIVKETEVQNRRATKKEFHTLIAVW
jgi:hypothetical protein